jgi:hypothetical protein
MKILYILSIHINNGMIFDNIHETMHMLQDMSGGSGNGCFEKIGTNSTNIGKNMNFYRTFIRSSISDIILQNF